uniref:Uroplakin 2 n=1 Tax=Equus caballus TaxID=9796 RepID=F7APY6_HORSE
RDPPLPLPQQQHLGLSGHHELEPLALLPYPYHLSQFLSHSCPAKALSGAPQGYSPLPAHQSNLRTCCPPGKTSITWGEPSSRGQAPHADVQAGALLPLHVGVPEEGEIFTLHLGYLDPLQLMVKSSFVVPPCRGRRELVSVVDSGAGFTVTRLSAYQVTNLVPGTKYYISYLVTKGASTESSREIPMSTLPRRKLESIGLGMARTGGMVVITVLLSVAMFLLVIGFIIALALGARK